MSDTFVDWFQIEFIPGFEKLMKKTIGEFTKPIRLAFVKPSRAPHIKKSIYFKKGGTMV